MKMISVSRSRFALVAGVVAFARAESTASQDRALSLKVLVTSADSIDGDQIENIFSVSVSDHGDTLLRVRTDHPSDPKDEKVINGQLDCIYSEFQGVPPITGFRITPLRFVYVNKQH